MSSTALARRIPDRRQDHASRLIRDLWWFIENVNEDTPDKTARFFSLRERVREYHDKADE